MLPVRVPKKKYGKFYAGDSYLCLNTSYKVPTLSFLCRTTAHHNPGSQPHSPSFPSHQDGRSRTLQWELHYWIGRKAPKVPHCITCN
jgi:hypothetical protein